MSSKQVLRCITFDVTGTLFRYKMHIGDIYCLSAKRCGQPCPDNDRMLDGFKKAYDATAKEYPMFGAFDRISDKDWWRTCVYKSFVFAGYDYKEDSPIFEKIFNRIYALFGSREPYHVFEDVYPFLDWCEQIHIPLSNVSSINPNDTSLNSNTNVHTSTYTHTNASSATRFHSNIEYDSDMLGITSYKKHKKNDIILGVISNASERYRTTILPILDLDSCFDFIAVSGEAKHKKPNKGIFDYASKIGHNFDIHSTSWLHIGDNKTKDYDCVKELGGNAVLLNRFEYPLMEQYKKDGIIVCDNLKQVQDYIRDTYYIEEPSNMSQDNSVQG